jgi:hypothetical protein
VKLTGLLIKKHVSLKNHENFNFHNPSKVTKFSNLFLLTIMQNKFLLLLGWSMKKYEKFPNYFTIN